MKRQPTLAQFLAAVAAAAAVWVRRPPAGRHAQTRPPARHRQPAAPQPAEAVPADA